MTNIDVTVHDMLLCRMTWILYCVAVAHAMARDGSSGGVIRLCVIDQSGIQKEVILGETMNKSSLIHVMYN